MARGQILNIPNQGSALVTTLSREEKASLSMLNPNDGVCYVKLNGPASNSPSLWDYKVPSQSYCQLPGPWDSLGVYYLDQSGSGRTAEVNVYELDSQISVPSFIAIGRAVQAAGSTVDISQGAQPSNPPASSVRLWCDGSGNLHFLESNGTDNTLIDSSNYNTMITMVGDVVGPLSNTQIIVRNTSAIYARDQSGTQKPWFTLGGYSLSYAMESGWLWRNYAQTQDVMSLSNAGALNVPGSVAIGGALSAGSTVLGALTVNSDIHGHDFYASRGDTTGVVYFGNNPGNIYIYYNGSAFSITASIICSSITSNGTIIGNILGTTNYIYTPTVYLNSSAAAPYIQNAGAAIRYWAAGIHSFEGNASGSAYGNIQCWILTAQGSQVNFGGANINYNGTYLNHSHSIQYNTTGNQIVWPNGSYISGNAGYVQGSQREQKQNIVAVGDHRLSNQVIDPRLVVYSFEWKEDNKRGLGFMLDEMEQVLPAYVKRDEDTGESVGYSVQELVAILWGAVRDLTGRIQKLEAV